MGLYSGVPRWDGSKYTLDDQALADSMAKAMDDAMANVYQTVKGKALPDKDKEDRRILFVAIAQGVLKYLSDHRNDAVDSIDLEAGGTTTTANVTALAVNITTS